jgi:tetratricopeptide (TPR) repeat protein
MKLAVASLALLLISTTGLAIAQQSPLPPGTHVPSGNETAQATGAASTASELASAEDKIAQKDFNGARTILDPYLAKHPDDARALFDLGYVEDACDNPDQAAVAYRKAIEANPKQFEAQLAMGLLLAQEGKTGQAMPYIEAATLLDPAPPNPDSKARAWRALAQLTRTTDPTRAKYALLEALKISKETTEDTLLTAEIAEASDDAETTEAAYRRVLETHPDSSAATAGLVHLLLKQKKFAEAEPILHSALERDPDDPALNAQWAAVLLEENKPAEALSALEKLHQMNPQDLMVGKMLAQTLTQAGQYAKSDEIYVDFLSFSPDDPALLAGHANALLRQEKFAESIPVFQKALKLRPDDGDSWAGLAFAASEMKQYAITLESLSMRSKYEAETPATYFLRATAYDKLHQPSEAAEWYQQFLQAAQGKFPDQEWQAKHRLVALGKMH